ncbi:MAG: hypothetical protein ACRCX4_13290 [Bacteroidales bacterium]
MRSAILYILFVLSIMHIHAKQNTSPTISNPSATLNNGIITISFICETNKYNSGFNYEEILIPILKNEANTMELPAIIAQGRHEQILMKRKIRSGEFINEFPNAIYIKKGASYAYNIEMKYEPWMNHSSLSIYSFRRGCCKTEPINNQLILDNIILEPAKTIPERISTAPVEPEMMKRFFKIHFKVSEATILPDFGNNQKVLSEIDNLITAQLKEDNKTRLQEIIITGHVSPEGPYKFNYELGQRRADALKHYICNRYPSINQSMIITKNGYIDWNYLVQLIEESNLTNKQDLVYIIKNTSPESDIESKIQLLDSGATYQKILKNIYPLMRIDSGIEVRLKYK